MLTLCSSFRSDLLSLIEDEDILKKSKFDEVYEVGLGGGTAIERFGKDPKPFQEVLDEFREDNFIEKTKRKAMKMPSRLLKFNSYCLKNYFNCLTAIIQVDLESPGFISQFPGIKEYLIALNGNYTHSIIYRFESLYDSVVESFNRYSGETDLEYVRSLIGILDKDLKKDKYEKYRVDDYVCLRFKDLWKQNNEELHDYLSINYVYKGFLYPKDYREILLETEVIGNSSLEDSDIRWVDVYFENEEKILEEVSGNIEKYKPEFLKKINLTQT